MNYIILMFLKTESLVATPLIHPRLGAPIVSFED